jgi:hypothetical protein
MLQPPRVHFRRLRRFLFPSLTTVSRLCRNSHAGYVGSHEAMGMYARMFVCTSTSSGRETWWTHCANSGLASQTGQTAIYPSTVMQFPDAMPAVGVSHLMPPRGPWNNTLSRVSHIIYIPQGVDRTPRTRLASVPPANSTVQYVILTKTIIPYCLFLASLLSPLACHHPYRHHFSFLLPFTPIHYPTLSAWQYISCI